MGNIHNSQEHKADVLAAIVRMLDTGKHAPEHKLYWEWKRKELQKELDKAVNGGN